MSFLSKILDKLGVKEAHEDVAASASPLPANALFVPSVSTQTASNPIAMVEVLAQLEQRAAASTQKLNWGASIVDLLKLLDLDSSLPARKELAIELRCPSELMNDSAQMNIWLHKNVLALVAANGGNIPRELLD